MCIDNRHNGMGVLSYSVRDGHFLFAIRRHKHHLSVVSLSSNG